MGSFLSSSTFLHLQSMNQIFSAIQELTGDKQMPEIFPHKTFS